MSKLNLAWQRGLGAVILSIWCGVYGWAQTDPPPLLEVKPATPASTQAGESVKLAQITFVGLQKRGPDAALSVSGLAVGASVTMDDIENAAQKLSDTGWFKKLGYRLKGTPQALTVTFTVEEETAANIPVVFDNFLGLADEDLSDAIRKGGVLGFDGTVAESGRAPEVIAQVLQDVLNRNRITGRVAYETLATGNGSNARLLYSIKDITQPVCRLTFTGANSVTPDELNRTAYELVRQDYSRYAAQVYAQYKLRPLYRQRGYWRAKFAMPTGRRVRGEKDCADGVELVFAVDEGAAYTWGAVQWTGATAYTAPELDTALDLKAGAVADERQFDRGMGKLNEAYQRKGYLDLGVRAEPTFDDVGHKVNWKLGLEEGVQYRMGRLQIEGFPPVETQDLLKLWEIKEGDVYNADYAQSFVSGPALNRLKPLGSIVENWKVEYIATPDKQKQTVAVVIRLVKPKEKP